MADVNALAQILSVIQSAPDDKTRRAAEAELKKREAVAGFPILLLQLVAAPLSADVNTQKAQNAVKWQAAIYFKNYVKRMWVPARDRDDDVKAPLTGAGAAAAGAAGAGAGANPFGAAAAGAAAVAADPISANDREMVKKNLAMLMLTAPPQLQKQLAEALQIIAASDFPKKWPTLLPDLVSKLTTKDYRVVNGVLETVASITNRYRYEMKSQVLWEEVDYVLKGFQQPLLGIYQQTYTLIGAAKNDATLNAQLPVLMQAMVLIARVFLALSAQDIPAFVEDHLKEFFMPFDGFLKYTNPALDSKDDSPGIVEQLKSTICDIVNLYTTKYDEQFEKYVGGFVGTVWGLLTTLKADARFDDLVTSGIRFLTVCVTKEAHKPLFNDAGRMKQICEMVIIPQLKLRDTDLDMFNDGLEYLRRDMEGSDVDTRRRTTVEFVRGLCVFFEKEITELLKNYIGVLLQAYTQNREKNYIAKDCAMYIVMALGAKGSTRKDGAVLTNRYIDVGQFYAAHVLPELQEKDVSKVPVLKADALKFLTVFRTQIPGAQYPNLMPLLAHLLSSSDYVVHTYAAIAIDRLLCVSDKGVARMGKDALKPMTQQLLTALFGVLGTAESAENEYVMKAIARVCRTAHDTITPYAKVIIDKVTSTLVTVAKAPKNPNFNHMLFETLACLISSMCPGTPALVDAFEQALLKPFQDILNMESATAFAPYIFQIFALMLEYRVGDVSAAYRSLFPMTYFPAMHENAGNIPPLTRLIQVYIMKAPALVGAQDQLVKVLGLFQRHLASKKHDVQAMHLLQFIVEFLKPDQFAFALPTIIQLLNAKVKNSRFNAYLGVFFSTFVSLHGAQVLIEVGNKVQPNWFGQMLAQNVLGSVGTLTGVERKVVAVGLIHMLCKSPVFVHEPFIKLYVKMLEAVVAIIELPPEPAAAGDDEEDALAAQALLGSNAQYARLVFAESKLVTNHDPFAAVQDVRKYFAVSLAAVTAQYRGKVPFAQLLGAVAPAVRAKLDAYVAAAGVQLSL